MIPPCPLCARPMTEHGTGAYSCPHGHQFLKEYFSPLPRPTRIVGREVMVKPWLPGAVLGGLALAVEVVRLVG